MALGSLPVTLLVLVFLHGLYMALVTFGNITDFDTNQSFVQHVLQMDTTNFGQPEGTGLDPDVMWRSVDATWLQDVTYLVLIGWEGLTAIVLLVASGLWIQGRSDHYVRARALSTIGLLMLLLLFFGGFIVVGGEWFQMWKSTAWNGLDPAFRNSVLALGTLILLHVPSTHWQGTDP
jgi:predicted small integral membrane protein